MPYEPMPYEPMPYESMPYVPMPYVPMPYEPTGGRRVCQSRRHLRDDELGDHGPYANVHLHEILTP